MPKDQETGLVEPDIVINGRVLTFAECMTVRVAVGNFGIMLSDPEMRLGIGTGLSDGYMDCLTSIQRTMADR